MDQPPPPYKRQKLTSLAERYRHLVGGYQKFLEGSDPRKIRPTPPPDGLFNTPKEQADHDALVEYQPGGGGWFRGSYASQEPEFSHSQPKGFTTAELLDLEAFAPLNTDFAQSFLHLIPIHKIWNKNHWIIPRQKHLARWPLKTGRPGYWEVSNEACSQLASLFLSNAQKWGWQV